MSKSNGKIELSQSRLEMIETGGRVCQILGLPRSIGQIYGLLYLAPKPLSLDHIVEMLGISKASASNGTRQLAYWRAIRQVWIPGERRDHFEVEGDLGRVIRACYNEFFKPRLQSTGLRLERMSESLDGDLESGLLSREEHKICSERLKNFLRLHKKFQTLAPMAEKLL